MSGLRETWERLRTKGLRRCEFNDVFRITEDSGELTGDDVAAINSYLRHFLPPTQDVKCAGCGRALGGFLGRFVWGLRNGEGYCAECGYPARAIHRDFGPVEYLPLILQYHPDELTFEPAEVAS